MRTNGGNSPKRPKARVRRSSGPTDRRVSMRKYAEGYVKAHKAEATRSARWQKSVRSYRGLK